MEYYEKCFVIMPFGETSDEHSEEYWTNHFEDFLKPAIRENLDIPVERAPAIKTGVLRDIIHNLIFAKIVIADITDLHATVFWELGVRQSFTHGTIIIVEKGSPVPFDLSLKGVLKYPKLNSNASYHRDMKRFQDELIAAVKDCEQDPGSPDTHILEAISGRGTIFDIICREESLRKIDAIIAECDYNVELLNKCSNFIESNRKKQKYEGWASATTRIKTSAVEILSSTRYLNEDPSFYRTVNEYFDALFLINPVLDRWMNKQHPAEGWLSTRIPTRKKIIEEFKEKMADVRKNVEKII
jgi:hypothetical protein